jgi:hypothetical protein
MRGPRQQCRPLPARNGKGIGVPGKDMKREGGAAMIDRVKPRPNDWVGRVALCSAVSLAAAGAGWITPPPASQTPTSQAATAMRSELSHPLPPPTPLVPRAHSAPFQAIRGAGGGFTQAALAVTRWGWRSGDGARMSATRPIPVGKGLILWMKLAGGMAAVNQIRRRGSIVIEIHWTRETSGSAGPGAPDLVTRLSIGHPGLADRLAAEVRRTGFFEWHSWAEKTSLSPGKWSVSLTYPNGQPLACGTPPTPCRFHLEIG